MVTGEHGLILNTKQEHDPFPHCSGTAPQVGIAVIPPGLSASDPAVWAPPVHWKTRVPVWKNTLCNTLFLSVSASGFNPFLESIFAITL